MAKSFKLSNYNTSLLLFSLKIKKRKTTKKLTKANHLKCMCRFSFGNYTVKQIQYRDWRWNSCIAVCWNVYVTYSCEKHKMLVSHFTFYKCFFKKHIGLYQNADVNIWANWFHIFNYVYVTVLQIFLVIESKMIGY